MSPNPIVKVQLQGRAPAGVAGLEREGDASSFSACLAGLMSLPRYPFQQGPKTGRPENPAAPAERETGVTPGPAGQAAVALADGSGDLWPAAAEGTQRVGRGAEATVLVSPAGGAGTKGPGGSLRAAVPAEGAAASIPELSPSRGGAQSPDERILPTANFSRSSASFGAVPSGLPAAGEEVAQAIPRAAAGPGEHGQRRPGAGPHGVRVADKGAAGTV
ncbi:MAG TPA: hypothetical protein DEA73_07800, partial [Peptococcaceae bacterium]|nr:hypothetical protein [Peptococcaceae bacterium]